MNPAHLGLHRRTPAPEDIDFTDIPPRPAPPAAPRAFLITGCSPFGPGALQSMRVVMVLPGLRPAEPPPVLRRERIALQSVPAERAREGLRAVQGPVVRDSQGRLFERHGDGTLHALGRVLAGAQGELYEWTPSGHEPIDDEASPEREESDADTSNATGTVEAEVPDTPAPRTPRRLPRRTRAAPPPAAGSSCPPSVRMLLPAPGKWVQVRLGDYAALLHGQIARPERLTADYRLGGWLQVFEADGEIEPSEAARQLFGDAGATHRIAPWNVSLARTLGVSLGTHGGEGTEPSARTPGRIAAGRRFFAVTVASDPTTDESAGTPAAAVEPAKLRLSVPPHLQAAVTPQLSREQAVAALQQATPPRWWQRWRHRVGSAARREWQARLTGRNLDEQLWSVAPPPHGLGDAAVREWVDRTLRLAGYDASRMSDEWEIFWRRRGALD